MSEIAYVALGSNLGHRRLNLSEARRRLAELPGCAIVAESEIEETDPLTLDPAEQGPYLNQIVALETSMPPHLLLSALQKIEEEAGRTRERKWAPRTLDLDIVLFGAQSIDTPSLRIPHPELRNRVFWQRELRQIRPDL